MSPTEFTLWLNGATDVVDGVPSPEQWSQIKEKLSEAMGHLAKRRLLERAEDLARSDEEMAKREAFAKAAMDLKIREVQDEINAEYQRRTRYGGYGAPVVGDTYGTLMVSQTEAKPGALDKLMVKLGGAA